MEQDSVETFAIPLGLTDGIRSHGQTCTQLEHSSRTDGMYGGNRAVLKLLQSPWVWTDGRGSDGQDGTQLDHSTRTDGMYDGTLGLTDGLWSHGQTGTQLDHSSRTDGMYGWNIVFD